MLSRLGDTDVSPTSCAAKEKSHPPLPNEVTNGSDAAAMNYRKVLDRTEHRKQGSERHRSDRSRQGSSGSPV